METIINPVADAPQMNGLAPKTRAQLDAEIAAAAKMLLDEYLNNKELTIFTSLDSEPFYDYETT